MQVLWPGEYGCARPQHVCGDCVRIALCDDVEKKVRISVSHGPPHQSQSGGKTTVYLCRVQEEIGDTRAEDVPVLLSHVCEADPGRNLLAGLHRRSSEQVFLACGGETQQPENAPRNLAEDA